MFALENGVSSTLILDAPLVLKQGTDLKMWNQELWKNFTDDQH